MKQVIYAAGSRGNNYPFTRTRQQRKSDFDFTLCRSRDLPVKHNGLSDTIAQMRDASFKKLQPCDDLTNEIRTIEGRHKIVCICEI